MIRSTLCFALLLASFGASYAQQAVEQSLELAQRQMQPKLDKPAFTPSLAFGLHGGMVMSRVNFVPSVSQRLHSGLTTGALLRYNVERGASIQLEVNYVAGGWREKYDAAETSYSHDLNALEIPLLTHLYLGAGAVKAYVNAGPFLGYILSEQSHSTGEDAMSDQDKLRHEQALATRFFWGLGGGPGLSFQLGKHHRVELEGRFVYGLGNLWSTSRTAPYPQSSEMRFGARLGYVYQF